MQATVHQGSWEKAWGLLVAKAWSDDALKERLMKMVREKKQRDAH